MASVGNLLNWRPTGFFSASRRQLILIAAATVSILVLVFGWHNRDHVQRAVSNFYPSQRPSAGSDEPESFHEEGPLCRRLPGAEDVLVVMKTGANEVEDKLAVHLRTTLTCYPNHVIFSDFEEDLPTGEHLYDAFTYTSENIRENHRDFALWRKLHAEGRAALKPDELSGTDSREKSEDIRKKIPGWQLDKWKFLPMVNQTLALYPDKHWYVFVEADTYILWSNLLPYLAEKTWTDDHYIGSRAVIEELGFAHGGSGFMLSRSALEKVVDLFNNNKDEWEAYNDRYWVGDHILASALRKAGVLLENGVPSWQGQPVGLLDFRPTGEGFWCSTAMTFHHQLPSEIEDLWNFEQQLLSERSSYSKPKILRHKDVLEKYVLPRVELPKSDWDNKAGHTRNNEVKSMAECEAICEKDENCMQYALSYGGSCRTTADVVYGEASERVESAWMLRRIEKSLEKNTC